MNGIRVFAFCTLMVGLVACGAGDVTPPTAKSSRAPVGLANGGFLPLPAVNDKVEWDGSMVDLMAADALALCMPWWRTDDEDTAETDKYLNHLITLMGNHSCGDTAVNLEPKPWWVVPADGVSVLAKWATQRTKDDECNLDPVTGKRTTVQAPEYEGTSAQNRWYAYDILAELNPPTAPDASVDWFSKREAAHELGLAGMNLCMASRLREQMLSADALVASGDAQRELLEVIRERAGLSLLQFTLLGLAFANSTSTAPATPLTYRFLHHLRTFAVDPQVLATNGTGRMDNLGADYARALRFYVDATEELTELFARGASAKSDLAAVGGFATQASSNENWSDGSWRGRLLNLLYGGDPLGGHTSVAFGSISPQGSFNKDWGAFSGIGLRYSAAPGALLQDFAGLMPHVTDEIKAPEVFTLLGLARQANALYLSYGSGGSPSTTGHFLYRAVEASLRRQKCLRENPGQTCPVVNADDSAIVATTGSESPPVLANYANAELWLRYRVTPDHAMKLANVLHQAFRAAVNTADRPPLLFTGTFDFIAKPPQIAGADTVDRWLHVDPNFAAQDLPPWFLASRYQINAGAMVPNYDLDSLVSPRLQGFVLRRSFAHTSFPLFQRLQAGASNQSVRYVGAVPLLAAVRDGLLRAKRKTDSQSPGPAPFFAHAEKMMDVISSAIGPVSYSVRPETEMVDVTTASQPVACHGMATTCKAAVNKVNGTKVKVQVDLVRPANSPAAQIVAVDASSFPVATRGHLEHVANVAATRYSAAHWDTLNTTMNLTRAQLDALPGTALTNIGNPTPTLGLIHERASIEWEGVVTEPFPVNTVPPCLPNGQRVLLLRLTTTPVQYVVLADGTGLGVVNASNFRNETRAPAGTPVVYTTDGKYGSLGGSFNFKAAQVWASQKPNFAAPAFDAFGIPQHWLPPTSPELIGAEAGEDSVAFYVRSARTAADDATAAVRFALESVIGEKADSQKLAAVRERSAGIRLLEKQQICGISGDCSVQYEYYVPRVGQPCEPGEEVCLALALMTLKLVPKNGYLLLKPVADALKSDVSSPSFLKYAGGELEVLATRQWNAIRDLETALIEAREQLRAMREGVRTAELQAAAILQQIEDQNYVGDELMKQASWRWRSQCSICLQSVPTPLNDVCCISSRPPIEIGPIYIGVPTQTLPIPPELQEPEPPRDVIPGDDCVTAMEQAIAATTSTSHGEDSSSTSHNSGPWYAQQLACKEAEIAFFTATRPLGINESHHKAALQDASAKKMEMWSSLAASASKLVTLSGNVILAGTEINRVLTKAALVDTRVQLDSAVEQAGVASQLSLSRRYHHYDLWRARALLENARRLSAAARRAIEGRFAVNLSDMTANEPFVAAPAQWANEVYEYDLAPPAAVGLTVAPTTGKDGIYPNKVSDYVRNLENFVRGYSVKRPTATATGDTEVVTIDGPEVRDDPSSSPSDENRVVGQSTGWTFQCKNGDPWLTSPAAATLGRAVINWSFSRNATAPFENEGFGMPLSLSVLSGSFGAPVQALGGKALNFTGNATLATPATAVGSSPAGFTILTWVNLRSYGSTGNSSIIAKQRSSAPSSSNNAVRIMTSAPNGKWWGGVFLDGQMKWLASSAATNIPKNTWVQVGMTFDGRVQRTYKNGVEIANTVHVTPEGAPKSIDWGTNGRWEIGSVAGEQPTDGWIGPTLVDGVAYSTERILAEYKKTLATTAPTVAWQFRNAGGGLAGCGAQAAADCAAAGCGCSSDICTGGTCETLFDVSVGSGKSLGLYVGAGTGTPAIGPASPSGIPSVEFSGQQSLGTFPTTEGESSSGLTVSAWVYVRNQVGNAIQFVAKNYNATTVASPFSSVSLRETPTGKLRATVVTANGSTWAESTAPLPRNEWAHIAMTYDATTVRVYHNGVVNGSFNVTGAPIPIDWNAHGGWFLGGNALDGGDHLDGRIADVRVEPRTRSEAEVLDLYHRSLSGACYSDDACVGTLSCCASRTQDSSLRTMCNGSPPERAKIAFHLDPWGRQDDYYANPPYARRHNVRWGRLAVNLVGVGIRDCTRAKNPTRCYGESFLRYNLAHSGPTWVADYDGKWVGYGLPIGQVEGGKALAVEEWLDPVTNSYDQPFVTAVQRYELSERPVGGAYELDLEVTPEVRLDRIEQVQLLMETDYWVRQK